MWGRLSRAETLDCYTGRLFNTFRWKQTFWRVWCFSISSTTTGWILPISYLSPQKKSQNLCNGLKTWNDWPTFSTSGPSSLPLTSPAAVRLLLAFQPGWLPCCLLSTREHVFLRASAVASLSAWEDLSPCIVKGWSFTAYDRLNKAPKDT